MLIAEGGPHCSGHNIIVFGAMLRANKTSQIRYPSKKGAIFLLAFFICFSIFLTVEPILVSAADPYGLDNTATAANLPMDPNASAKLPAKVGQIVGIALSFVGTLFFILIIYAGVMWMTAAGNDQQVGKAKEIIIAATIGLVIVLSAYAITMYVGNALTNTAPAATP